MPDVRETGSERSVSQRSLARPDPGTASAGCEGGAVVAGTRPCLGGWCFSRYSAGTGKSLSAAEIRPEREPTRGSVALPFRGVVLARRVTPSGRRRRGRRSRALAGPGRAQQISSLLATAASRSPGRSAARSVSAHTRECLYERGTAVKPCAFTGVDPLTPGSLPRNGRDCLVTSTLRSPRIVLRGEEERRVHRAPPVRAA